MAAPNWQATATFQSGGAVQLTVAWPAHQADDIALLFVSSNADVGLLTANGFVQVPDSPQAGTGVAMSVWWCRATSGSMASPVTNTGTNNVEATMITIRGAITSGNPWEVTAGSSTGLQTTVSVPGGTTTINDQLVVFAVGRSSDVAGGVFSGESATNVASLAERVDDGTATGNGGGIGVWTGTRLVAGAFGPLTTTNLATTSGQAYWSASIQPASSAVTGTIGATQAAQTAAFTGTVLNPITGTVAATQAAQVGALTGSESFLGTIAATQANQTGALSGTVLNPITGTIAATQADQTGAFVGSEGMSGTIAATQTDQTMAATGTEGISGTVGAVQADQVGAFTGTNTPPAVTGTIGATQDDNTGSLTGTESILGVLAATQDDQTAALAGTVANPISGVLGAVQDPDTATFTGTVVSDGTLNSTQDDQTGTFTGTVSNPVTGTIAVTQQDQTGTLTGTNTPPAVTGTIGATQDDQVGSFTGIAAFGVVGVLGAVQDDQTGSFTGVALLAVTGVLGAVQDDQTATFTGTVIGGAVTGTIAAVQDPNVGSFVGTTVSPILPTPGTVVCVLTAPTAECVLAAATASCVLAVAAATCTISPVNVTAGTNVEITTTFRKANGVLADPTTVTALIKHPDGTTSAPTPTSSSVGIWTTVIPTDDPGYWFYQISGAGNDLDVVCVGSFCAQPSLVLV